MSLEEKIESNYRKIVNYIENAERKSIDLLVFPEMALTGYGHNFSIKPVETEIVEKYFNKINKNCEKSNVNLVLGWPRPVEGKTYNAASVISINRGIFTYHKINLIEEERPHYTAGSEPLTFTLNGHKFGVIICKDQDDFELIRSIKKAGAEVLFIIAAHYYSPEEARWKLDKNRALPIARAVENGLYVFKANTVGAHINKISLGNSLIVSPEGVLVNIADEFSETMLTYEI